LLLKLKYILLGIISKYPIFLPNISVSITNQKFI
jgi:hypothetical protein